MLYSACEKFMGKSEDEVHQIAAETLEGHQRAIMGNMTVEVLLVAMELFLVAMEAACCQGPPLCSVICIGRLCM